MGYGLSGRFFHAPLIAATDGLKVVSVVPSSASRREQVAAEHPRATPVSGVEELWSGTPPALVVVATPNRSHVPIATAAIERGIAVVVDKPLAVTAAEAEALVERAKRAGVGLTVFQNRRWDTEHLTLQRLISEGALGQVVRYESRFERWRPEGRLVAGEQSIPVPPEPGAWPRFYELLRDCLLAGAPPPVDPYDAVASLRVLEAARRASYERSLFPL